ncbi:MAG: sulfurtransferase TusA family protein [Firmicutes bacterium]|nr:sulfurtransferase TusA family protein [Bacillota bacterium]
METLDVRGLSCPIPVMKTKKAIDKGCQELQIIGSSNVSQENVSKFVASQGFKVELINNSMDEWNLIITKK